jgi:restriction system protein
MAFWLVRAGSRGEHEAKFLDEGRAYLTWWLFDSDISKLDGREGIKIALRQLYPDDSDGRVNNFAAQINAYANRIKVGDWVAMPSKFGPLVHFGQVTSEYIHHPEGPNPYYHYRNVDWSHRDFPRSSIDPDLLHSLGAFSTICLMHRNNAEERLLSVLGLKAIPKPTSSVSMVTDEILDEFQAVDLESDALEAIRRQIQARFSGHKMANLVKAVLEAEGLTVLPGPDGSDGGIDLLASRGTLGLEQPLIAVQVKSQQSPVEHLVLQHLKGAMQDVGATHGLLVAWGGFKVSYRNARMKEHFFVRLWSSDDLVRAVLMHYDRLPAEIRSELPLKKIWILAPGEI